MDGDTGKSKNTASLIPKYKTGCWSGIGRSVRARSFSRRRVTIFLWALFRSRLMLSSITSQIPIIRVSWHVETADRLNAMEGNIHRRETFFRLLLPAHRRRGRWPH